MIHDDGLAWIHTVTKRNVMKALKMCYKKERKPSDSEYDDEDDDD